MLGKFPASFGGSFDFDWQRIYKVNRYNKLYNFYLFPSFRFAWHPNFGVKGLDVYALGTFGIPLAWQNYKYGDANHKNHVRQYFAPWAGFFGIGVGVHYFFSDHFGVFSELGWLQLGILKLGISLGF
jgi:hypothetical protein